MVIGIRIEIRTRILIEIRDMYQDRDRDAEMHKDRS